MNALRTKPRRLDRRHRALLAVALVSWLASLSSLASSLKAQRPLNLDFELPAAADSTQPWGWSRGWATFQPGPAAQFALDRRAPHHGAFALRIVAGDSSVDAPARNLMLQLPADFVRGSTLVLTGAMRVRDLQGRARVSLEAWGDRVVLAADSALLRGDARADVWQRFRLRITVPRDPSIHSFVIMPAVQGSGSAWFDDLSLTRDGTPLTQLPGVTDAAPEQLRWLASRSAVLTADTAPASPASADLALFDHIIGDARVIGLGESTHGTSEFFSEKHRLIRHLIETKGVRVFALEANQRAVARLDRYVRDGIGSARDALRAVFAVWNTEEMLRLIEWLRAYNVTHPHQRVQVVGYDMQDHHEPMDSLLAFLGDVDPALQQRVGTLTRVYRESPSFAVPQAPDSLRHRWLTDADGIVREMNAQRARWIGAARTATDSQRIERAVHDADLYRQAARLNASLSSPDRDSLMAANLAWALHTVSPAARVVVWAHDMHISRGGDRRRSFNAGAQMGAVLTHTYRVDYRAISLLTRAGHYTGTRSFTDHRTVAASAFPAPRGSVEHLLASAYQLKRREEQARARIARRSSAPFRGLIVDLRVDERDRDGAWLWTPRPVRSIGYMAYDYGFEIAATMPLEFDGVILIDETHASRPLRPK